MDIDYRDYNIVYDALIKFYPVKHLVFNSLDSMKKLLVSSDTPNPSLHTEPNRDCDTCKHDWTDCTESVLNCKGYVRSGDLNS